MEKETYRSQFRLPWELYEKLKTAAEEGKRSLNAEIAYRLDESFRGPPPKPAQFAAERRKLELVSEYLDWCRSKGKAPEKSHVEFCDFYNDPTRAHDGVDSVSDIDQITPDYLHELHGVWFLERDARYPHQAADVRYIIEAMEAKLEAREQELLYKVEQIAKRSE